jgi:hypothetical protein
MTIKPILGTCAVMLVTFASAASVWFDGAGTALAPEPARLRAPLTDTVGASADAYWLNTTTSTTVVRATGSYRYFSPAPPAGTPCSTTTLEAGQQTSKVIVASGNYRKCV